ncbi:MAG: recombination mediator RecR [Candidatus Gracilibacteria bacterium]|nr:recombination mediator RecR [Candidatus Gracilibacteria bacterium]
MPETLKRLIDFISYMPGIGEKTAVKLAFFLLKANGSYVKNFARELEKLQTDVHDCRICFGLTDGDRTICSICSDGTRHKNTLCVVEDYLDMLSIERLGIFHGYYHILGGSISPIHGRMPNVLHFQELFDRVRNSPEIEEIIIATNPNIEGEATNLYIEENIPRKDLKLTRLSKGLPNAGYIEYADDITLINAFKGRIEK